MKPEFDTYLWGDMLYTYMFGTFYIRRARKEREEQKRDEKTRTWENQNPYDGSHQTGYPWKV